MVTERVTRIDSPSTMAPILLDIDGCLHISGQVIPGAREAVAQLRVDGHRLRFITNNTIRSARSLAAGLRELGFELEDDELQTAPRAAAHALAGRRVLALTMPAIVEDLEGIVLCGEDADAVMFGGADEVPETNQVFSYMNLARAFAELEAGAELYCLHKNRWWQTLRGPMLDSGAFVTGLEYAAGVEATVLGKPSAPYFQAALDALDAEPQRTWMVGDDVEADVGGAQALGVRGVLVRTGKYRDEWLARSRITPDAVLDSVADLPTFLDSLGED
jgi:HAD superfamily hydrolase (TIGR01458 family)